ncbi:MAG: hypothetical protein LUD16_08775 [Lachnospiraceae bacterium]|nr:hypothetical protein [Lachnospiraceae bacterium]
MKIPAEVLMEKYKDNIDEDGSIWLYYQSHKVDITEYLSESRNCKLAINDNGTVTYFDIESNGSGGYSLSASDSPEGSAEDYTIVG